MVDVSRNILPDGVPCNRTPRVQFVPNRNPRPLALEKAAACSIYEAMINPRGYWVGSAWMPSGVALSSKAMPSGDMTAAWI